ncbi:hypothetical protein F4813DRAFT_387455 [Daldinia decipiens]|uniref:uncharacterized protein n=1 Tax=Daldinia decipiens TaxID=326647 RepID=UPI0020C5877B|nr:uncharacterized protein F4813DRAFT_387455 [Daldinia decipiens]KAI1659963.1 hypothetical protein F4813DRAFT_387455 [Daldinia decipiens]
MQSKYVERLVTSKNHERDYLRPNCIWMTSRDIRLAWGPGLIDQLRQPAEDIIPASVQSAKYIAWIKTMVSPDFPEEQIQSYVCQYLAVNYNAFWPQKDESRVMYSIRVPWLSHHVVRQSTNGEYCCPVTTKPDLAFGYRAQSIKKLSLLSDKPKAEKLEQTYWGMAFPYLIMEFKVNGKEHVGHNQLLGAGSSVLNALNKISMDNPCVICALVQVASVTFYLMWSAPGVTGETSLEPEVEPKVLRAYKMSQFARFYLDEEGQYKDCLMLMSQIHAWGKGLRLNSMEKAILIKISKTAKFKEQSLILYN